jgi:hypothetical protein
MKVHQSLPTAAWAACALVLLVGLQGCAQDGLGDPTGSTCPADSTLTYETYGQVFMQSHCARCHGDLATHEGVKASIDRIDRSAAAGPDSINTYMPEGEDVSDGERRKLGEWLACGAP